MSDVKATFNAVMSELVRLSPDRLADIDVEAMDQMISKLANYDADAKAFVLLTIQDAAVSGEPPRLVDVQRRILKFLLTETNPAVSHTPADLADAISERNRKVLREAGRLLVAKKVLSVATEPCDSSEGERVLSYKPTEAIEKAFEEYQDTRNGFYDDETLIEEAASAEKQ
jgi:hypothetical protein